jgi:glucokinase
MEAIGIDVGGTNLRVARVDDDGNIIVQRAARTSGDAQATLSVMLALVREVDHPAVAGIGVGAPGRVDAKARKVLSGGYLDLSRVDVTAALERATGKPVVIDSDANLALLAEWRFGAATGIDNVLLMTIGTGIGGAAIVDGRLLRGRSSAAQFGHVTVDFDGGPCACGRIGCVETTSSGTALNRLIAEAELPAMTRVEELLADADRGNAGAVGLLSRWALPLRAAIDSLVAVLDPERVVLGGGLGWAAAKALRFAPAVSPWYQAPVVAAALADNAGVIGGAWAAMNPEVVAS